MQAEAVVDTLVQDAAELGVTLDQKDGPAAVFVSTLGSGETGWTTTDDNDIVVSHTSTSLSEEAPASEMSDPDKDPFPIGTPGEDLSSVVARGEGCPSASRRKKRFEPCPS